MRTLTVMPAAVVLVATALVAPVSAANVGGGHGGRPLDATLTGAAERPGPGDPDGSGTALVTINRGQQEFCWSLEVSDIATATAAHIHRGGPETAGPVVVALSPPADGDSSGCVDDVDVALIDAIRKNPGAYYVNVHNADHPSGAVRGQLSK